MQINKALVKTIQKIWNKDWIIPGRGLKLTDDQAECLTSTLIQWKVYNTLNRKEVE